MNYQEPNIFFLLDILHRVIDEIELKQDDSFIEAEKYFYSQSYRGSFILTSSLSIETKAIYLD